jgi:hypothetical protein
MAALARTEFDDHPRLGEIDPSRGFPGEKSGARDEIPDTDRVRQDSLEEKKAHKRCGGSKAPSGPQV